jgi:hypothetical protein
VRNSWTTRFEILTAVAPPRSSEGGSSTRIAPEDDPSAAMVDTSTGSVATIPGLLSNPPASSERAAAPGGEISVPAMLATINWLPSQCGGSLVCNPS